MSPTLSPEVGTAVEQLITLLTQQKHVLEAHTEQIQDLALRQHGDRVDVKQIHALMERVAKAESAAQKLRQRVDSLEEGDHALDDDVKAIQQTMAHIEETLQRSDEVFGKLRSDLVLFWRMTFLERLAWLLGGARLFSRAARLLVWWRTRWPH